MDLADLNREILLLDNPSSDTLEPFLNQLINNKESTLISEYIKTCFTILEKCLPTQDQNLIFRISAQITESCESVQINQYINSILSNSLFLPHFKYLCTPQVVQSVLLTLENSTNKIILKNICTILQENYAQIINYLQIDQLNYLLDSEHPFMRVTYLTLIINQSVNTQSVATLVERTLDINFTVRAKALTLLADLFENRKMPLKIRKEVIALINKRILDKTQIVRKKALLCMGKALSFHPFVLCNGTLELEELDDKLFESNLKDSNEEKVKKTKKSEVNQEINAIEKYKEDLIEFRSSISDSLSKINTLLQNDFRSELEEILDFLSMCFFFGIKDCICIYNNLFVKIQNNGDLLETAILKLCDLLVRLKEKKIYFFLHFEMNCQLKLITQLIAKKGIFDKNTFQVLFKEFRKDFCSKKLFFLSNIIRFVEIDPANVLEVIDFVSKELFRSANHSELIRNVKLFRITLDLLSNFRNTKLNGEVIHKLSKIYVKMNFFDFEISQKIVKLCFESGSDYENNVIYLIKLISTKNPNLLKLMFVVGCIAEEQSYLIDLMELKAKKVKNLTISDSVRKSINEQIRERRRSVNAFRLSLHRKLSCEETNKALQNIISKPEDEILDILFFVKERELLFSKDSLLQIFIPLILQNCTSSDSELANVAYLSYLKCALCSTEFFEVHFEIFKKGFLHSDSRIRNNCVIAFRDLFFNCNFLLDNHLFTIFNALEDKNLEVRKSALLVIFDLLIKNVMRIKNFSLNLSLLILDPELGLITRCLFKKLSNSLLNTIFYETCLFKEPKKVLEILDFFLEFLDDKVKENCFVKLMRNCKEKEVLKWFVKKGLTERFVEQMRVYEAVVELME